MRPTGRSLADTKMSPLPCRYAEEKNRPSIRLLAAERAALGKASLTTSGLAEDSGAALADDDSLGVGEDSGDGEAAGALDIHEEGAGSRHKGLQRVVSISCRG